MSLFDDWAKVLRQQAQAYAQAKAEEYQHQTFREQASQRTESKSRKPVEITARRAMHAAAIAMAMDSHCGDPCIHCQSHGRLWYPETMQNAVCPHCHGFGKRELRPDPPRYTFHGAVYPVGHSIINLGITS